MTRKLLATFALSAAIVGGSGATAFAHECYIANRSAQGNAGAAHSANWHTLQMSELFASAHFFVPGIEAPLTQAQIDEAVQLTKAAGIPTSVTLFGRFTIPRNLDEADELTSKSVDGKGVDHFFAKYGDQLIGIALTVSQ